VTAEATWRDVVDWLRENCEENHDPAFGYIEHAEEVATEIELHFSERS
jgi:hypothetical protein